MAEPLLAALEADDAAWMRQIVAAPAKPAPREYALWVPFPYQITKI